jgi:hypothetical protein
LQNAETFPLFHQQLLCRLLQVFRRPIQALHLVVYNAKQTPYRPAHAITL